MRNIGCEEPGKEIAKTAEVARNTNKGFYNESAGAHVVCYESGRSGWFGKLHLGKSAYAPDFVCLARSCFQKLWHTLSAQLHAGY